MKRSKKVTLQILICFGLCIVTTLSSAQNIKDVIIANPDSQPVPVVNEDKSAHSPFWASNTMIADNVYAISPLLNVIPLGKRLVIEFVSWECRTPPNDNIVRTAIGVTRAPDSFFSFSFPITKLGIDANGLARWAAAQPVRIYCDTSDAVFENRVLAPVFERDTNVGTASCTVTISGYTVNMP